MAITEEGVFVCDYCGEDTGKFNNETGNHVSCEELHAIREGLKMAIDELFLAYPVDIFPDTTQAERHAERTASERTPNRRWVSPPNERTRANDCLATSRT